MIIGTSIKSNEEVVDSHPAESANLPTFDLPVHTCNCTLPDRLEYFDPLSYVPSVEGVVVLATHVFTNLS